MENILNLSLDSDDNINSDISAPSVQSTSEEDVLLLRRIDNGDEAAFLALYQRYNQPIFNYLFRFVHDRAEAEDLLQEVFIGVWRGAGVYRGQAKVKTWIYRIAHNRAVSWLRRHRETLPFELNDVGDGRVLEDDVDDTWKTDALMQMLTRLSLKHREVLELAFLHEMSYIEIAEVVGCPVGTVKSRMSYALKAMKVLSGKA